ncbi:MAG: cytochrome c biogenesis protein ResB [Anaeromyxobacteraceae bacterium]
MRLLSVLTAELRWFLAALRERSFVVSIIGLVTLLYSLGLVVPQRRVMPAATWAAWREQSPRLVALLEGTGLADVYRAPVTYIALGFFFLSLLAVVVDRLPRLLRRTRLDQGLPLDAGVLSGRRGTVELRTPDPGESIHVAEAFLRGEGYRLHGQGTGAVRGVRFRLAPLGFVLFHGAFALLLAGGVLLALTRFSAEAEVGEGEPFEASRYEYAAPPREPRVGARRPDLAFTVTGVRPRSEGGQPISLHVELLLRGERSPRVANVNEPVNVGTTSVLASSAGPMPLFTCEAGDAEDGAWVKLLPNPSGRTRFTLEPCGLDVLARPYDPDASGAPLEERQGVMLARAGVSRLEDVAAIGIEVAVRGPEGATARGVLKPGGSLATPDGRRVLHMPELRYYAKLQIVAERGGGLLWAGFVLGTLGLVLRLVLFRREIVVAADPAGGRLLVATAADVVGWRPDELLDRLASAVGAPAGAGARPPVA